MKIMMELITNYYPISGNSYVDSFLYLFIGIIAFVVAFDLVGNIFDFIGIYDSKLMSGAHWSIRLVIFGGLAWLLKKLLSLISWLFSFQWWVYIILILALVGIIFSIHFLRHKVMKNRYMNDEDSSSTFEKSYIEVGNVVKNVRDYCPRCGKLLVERKGPYGYFWGCEGFRGKNDSRSCKYTRSIK